MKPQNFRNTNSSMLTEPADGRLNDLLARYAAGQLPPALHVLVASHLVLKDCSRGFVTCLESIGGQALEQAQPKPLSHRDQMLDAIFSCHEPERPKPLASSPLPEPLRQFLGKDLKDIHWRRRLPGLQDYLIDAKKGGEASLYLIKAGHKVPSHTHEGSEITLVLRGAFSDQTGLYGCGDIAIGDAELDHQPVAAPGEDCLCYSVLEGHLRLTGPIGRVIERLFRH
jgi:putative transcriptional regulator